MAAATATPYQDQQILPGNMLAGMDHNHFHQGAQLPFGDNNFMPFDPSFDTQNHPPLPPNQPPLLEPTESDYIGNFFNDPDSVPPSVNPFDYTARPEEKAVANGNTIYGAASYDPRTGTINQSAAAGPSHSPTRKTHVTDISPSGSHFSPNGDDEVLSPDDYTAANNLHSLKATPPSANFSSQTGGNGFGGSWGSFMMPQNIEMSTFGNLSAPNGHMQGGGQMRPQSMGFDQQPLTQAQLSRAQHFYAQPQPANQTNAHPQQSQPSRQRNLSVDTAGIQARQQQLPPSQPPSQHQSQQHSQSGRPHAHNRPPLPQWGSDSNFNDTGYNNPNSLRHQGKETNLLNLYGAHQAALDAHKFPQSANPHMNGRGAITITSPTGQPAGGSWGVMGVNPAGSGYGRTDDDDGNPRKRRKSQTERDEGDWAPGHTSTLLHRGVKTEESDDELGDASQGKRRKSTFMTPNSPTGLDDDDDDTPGAKKRRGSKKPRETLTEAQKRDNHIKSEKKRREIITNGYSELNQLVPCLASGKSGLSRSECLQEVASYLASLVAGTKDIMRRLELTDADAEVGVTAYAGTAQALLS